MMNEMLERITALEQQVNTILAKQGEELPPEPDTGLYYARAKFNDRKMAVLSRSYNGVWLAVMETGGTIGWTVNDGTQWALVCKNFGPLTPLVLGGM